MVSVETVELNRFFDLGKELFQRQLWTFQPFCNALLCVHSWLTVAVYFARRNDMTHNFWLVFDIGILIIDLHNVWLGQY